MIPLSDIRAAAVRGLKGATYLDKVVSATDPPSKQETRDVVTFDGPVDSVYLGAGGGVVELDVGTGAAVAIASKAWEDVVVWNPWTSMEACYESFACVENAQAGKPVSLAPGKSWTASADFSVVDLE